MDETTKAECIEIMRGVSLAHAILPSSYHLSRITSLREVPTSEGGFTDILEGEWLRKKVCVNKFKYRPQETLENMKRVRDNVRPESERSLITIRISIVKS